MASRRAAVLVAAAAAALMTAHAAPAAALGVQVSLPGPITSSLPKDSVRNVEATVKTPVLEASVEVSSSSAAASATVPPATAQPSTPAPSEPHAEARPERRPSDARRPQRHGRSERNAAPAAVDPPQVEHAGTVGGEPKPRSAPRPLPPEPATLTADGTLALADAVSPAGTTAALAALFVLAVVFASWIAPLIARTLAPPLLSFALQRPG